MYMQPVDASARRDRKWLFVYTVALIVVGWSFFFGAALRRQSTVAIAIFPFVSTVMSFLYGWPRINVEALEEDDADKYDFYCIIVNAISIVCSMACFVITATLAADEKPFLLPLASTIACLLIFAAGHTLSKARSR